MAESEMMKEVESVNQLARGLASGTMAEDEVTTAEKSEEKSEVRADGAEGEAPAEKAAGEVEEEEIRIGDQVFKTQAEAFRYAEKLEQEKLLAEAHSAGIQEVLRAQAASQPAPIVEDKFDEEFYANPKATLEKVKLQATADAEARIDMKLAREKQWDTFLEKYPDIRRKDAERILSEQWDTLGKITDLEKGMQVLAQRVRADYAELEEIRKPRTALPEKKGAQTSRSGGSPISVTPKENEARPLTLAEQMRTLKRHS